ncbi:L-type lectin-domain containing receptor kinase S.7 [Spatholobus suberectus]|nr:L-type lectin-domain containing receptor kinase S.7 [Spatholobus suberectus]
MIGISFVLSHAMASLRNIFLIFCLFIPLASLWPYPVAVHPASDVPTNVTKRFFFPDYNISNNPRLVYDVKLLGSARFSHEKGVLQIPSESQDTNIRYQAGPWPGMLNDACENDYKAVAVEFATRKNPEFGDPNDNHVGINLGTTVSSKIINVSDVGVSLKDGFVHRAWITYDGPQRRMDIRLGLANQEVYLTKPIFSEPVNLSPYLNEYMFVGFSASTGNHTQIHNILSWNFTSTSQAFLRFPSSETCQGKILHENSTTPPTSKKSAKYKPPLSFLIFVAAMALAPALLLGFYFISEHRRNAAKLNTSVETEILREIELLGIDSRGAYCRRKLRDGSQVAVKRFSAQFLDTYGSHKRRLLKEIEGISHVHHPNLLPVRGWCQDNHEIMVVYDFVPNGTLDKWLFRTGFLPWTRRFKAIKDVADGLSFLHTRQLAHKNLKCSSVFLDVNFRAVLGDVGFVLLGAESKQFESAVCQDADVFEFGILVLEAMKPGYSKNGKVSVSYPCDSRKGKRGGKKEGNPKERNVLDYFWNLHETDQKVKLVDRRMGSLINLEQAIRVLEMGLLCTLNESKGRPSMEQVVEFLLNMEKPIPELPRTRPVALFPLQ